MNRCSCGRIATERVSGQRDGQRVWIAICLGCAWRWPLGKTVDGLRIERIEPMREAVA
jgi:hypothetical protein